MKKVIILTLIVVLFSSCLSKVNLQDYYFQTNRFQNTLIYKFQSKNDKLNFQYWVIESDTIRNEITTKRYNKNRIQIDELKQQEKENGFELTSHHISGVANSEFIYDLEFHIKRNEVINWDTKMNAIYSGEFIDNGIIWELIRERKYVKNELISIDEKEYDVVIFDDSFSFTNLNKDETNAVYNNFNQKSYYAKNIGLVKYERKYIDSKLNDEWQLVQIFKNTNLNDL